MYCSNCGTSILEDCPTVCTQCDTTFWKNPRCCAGALVTKKNKIFLVRRLIAPWIGYWDIPGGYCESNEHPSNCAIRETLEETGIGIQIKTFHGIWLEPSDSLIYGHNICIYYIAEPCNNYRNKPDGIETDKGDWFSINALPDKIAFPNHIPDVLYCWKEAQKADITKA